MISGSQFATLSNTNSNTTTTNNNISSSIERRDSRTKRRRLSERRRLFGKTMASTSSTFYGRGDAAAAASDQTTMDIVKSSQDRRKSSLFASAAANDREDSANNAILFANSEQEKIQLKIQLHITLAPENEPLILGHHDFQQNYSSSMSANTNNNHQQDINSSPKSPSSTETTARKTSASIGDHIHERLVSRQNSLSQRRRQQQLLAMHSTATDQSMELDGGGDSPPVAAVRQIRSGSFAIDGGASSGQYRRDSGAAGRSSTITGGMQDEATAQFLARQRGAAAAAAAAANYTPPIRLNQALANSSNNIRQRYEQRQHIYFKRDGQRFGHEFTLKLAVDKNYRCLLKIRPLIPLQAISVQGQHLNFVDCSQAPLLAAAAALRHRGSTSAAAAAAHHQHHLSSSAPSSSLALSASAGAQVDRRQLNAALNNAAANASNSLVSNANLRHHSIGPSDEVGAAAAIHQLPRHMRNLAAAAAAAAAANTQTSGHQNHHQQQQHHHHRLHHAQTLASGDSIPLPLGLSERQLREQLLRQEQHQQMLRQFFANRNSPSSLLGGGGGGGGGSLGGSSQTLSALGISAGLGTGGVGAGGGPTVMPSAAVLNPLNTNNQLVYMFDWASSGSRYEASKNKNRTELQTMLKFKNGQLLSLPIQVKFYQPECRQHLSWGNQLHFIDYDCQINSLGQMSVERIQYY